LQDVQVDRLFELARTWIKQHKTQQQVLADV
jgi:hypothetical protein